MNLAAETVYANGLDLRLPVLLEWDRQGNVVSVSERARAAIGDAQSLAQMLAPAPREPGVPSRTWHMRFLFESAGHVVVGAQPAPEPTSEDPGAVASLRQIDARFAEHNLRLDSAQRRLAAHLAHTRPQPAAGQLVRALEAERQRLGRELHTGVGQMLAAIRLQLENALGAMPEVPPPAAQALGRIGTLAEDALDQVRSISRRLHPPPWQRMTLPEALRQMWEASGVPEKFAATLRSADLEREPDPEIKALLYRAAQEALSNVARHAPHATTVEMRLEAFPKTLRLTVRDNGAGFDAAAALAAPAAITAGLGLRSLHEEAAALGAIMRIESGPSGTVMTVEAAWELPDASGSPGKDGNAAA